MGQAKDLVRIRKHQEKFVNLNAQLRAIGLQMTSMASTQALAESMKKATRVKPPHTSPSPHRCSLSLSLSARRSCARAVNDAAQSKHESTGAAADYGAVCQTERADGHETRGSAVCFQSPARSAARLSASGVCVCHVLTGKQMVGDALEDAMDNDEDEVESEQVVNKVLDEIGIDMKEAMVDAPSAKPQVAAAAPVKADAKSAVRSVRNSGGMKRAGFVIHSCSLYGL
jgi:hypothetical protein